MNAIFGKNAKIIVLICFVVVIAIFVILYFMNTKEKMVYLNQYELQDHYKNNPDSWPVIFTSTTAIYDGKRMVIPEEKENVLREQKAYLEKLPLWERNEYDTWFLNTRVQNE